jgi:replicative DNA helicase
LKAFIKKIVDNGIQIDAIILDYVNLLTTTTGVNSYERVKYVTERLRALSYVFSCPVITATQLNRSGYNEINPGFETIGESYGLASTADCMFSIWQEEEDAELGIIKLGIMKNRFGQNFGACTLQIDYPTLTLTQDDSNPESVDIPDSEMNTLSFLSDE